MQSKGSARCNLPLTLGLLALTLLGVVQCQTSSFVSTTGGGTGSSSSFSSSSGGATTPTTPPPPQPPPAPAPAPALPTQTFTLPAFTGLVLCAPINVLIIPNMTRGYALTVTAEQAVLSSLAAGVGKDGLLSIATMGPINTTQSIQMTASLPYNALGTIYHQGPSAEIYVAPGFAVQSLNITTAYGAGQLYVNQVNATIVSILDHGLGPVTVTGSLGSVSASSDSLAPMYLSGVQTGAQLDLWSTSQAYVSQAEGSAITGTTHGLNTVYYAAGTCQLTNPFSTMAASSGLALSTCNQQTFLNIPQPNPTWTCGIATQGNFTCAAGSVLALSPSGSAVSQAGAPTLTSDVQGYFYSGQAPGGGGSQVQTGTAVPGSAGALSSVTGTGSVSSSASASSTPAGSTSTTQTTQNGATQGFTTSTGGQTQAFGNSGAAANTGVLVTYGPNNTATAYSQACTSPISAVRIPV